MQVGRLPSHFDFRFLHATHAPSVTVRLGFEVKMGRVCGCGVGSWSIGAGCRARKLDIAAMLIKKRCMMANGPCQGEEVQEKWAPALGNHKPVVEFDSEKEQIDETA